ncbi:MULTISPECIES: hypothetical protein [Streptomycetaceae]|uniref:Chorismate lyase n=1 Tax=Streptantibioticus cattleyicolor (strain ATCC 35852 / DSM 46488 / JCM 4925 / NBRC 14057 / NRRL 8057) TaxID=1003195 RepID=F8JQK7_STREN|nr:MULTISPECIES: hypothetical protein [Streptomycetaceae]AEW97854.1 hypothetical protein SCATT_54830 [Streptantibioticus cattleyicolor NRRL 8057 = DSM 46488]MYS62268.1 hypothetical protein [Streptomyces sp. SID5468]CCB78173.1 conserved protein of unknown function [Streptantibioticus cattleyicolor NRRL 8057 = DSM 46488]
MAVDHAVPAATAARGLPPDGFADPFTRRLLGRAGSTTDALQARLGVPLRVRVTAQEVTDPGPLDARLRTQLRLPPGEACLVRRSELRTGRGRLVSRNLVVGRLPGRPALAAAVTGRTVPMGAAAAVRAAGQRRVPLLVELAWWPGAHGPYRAVRRGYLLRLDEEAPLLVTEEFDPAVVPARLTATGTWAA